MRKLVLLLVALLAVPAMADITINVVDNGDGTGTVQITAMTSAPVGIGIVADANGGTIAGVDAIVDSFFDVYPDYYTDNPSALDDDIFSDDGGRKILAHSPINIPSHHRPALFQVVAYLKDRSYISAISAVKGIINPWPNHRSRDAPIFSFQFGDIDYMGAVGRKKDFQIFNV